MLRIWHVALVTALVAGFAIVTPIIAQAAATLGAVG